MNNVESKSIFNDTVGNRINFTNNIVADKKQSVQVIYNMLIEGFWYYLFLGVFEATTILYAVAKIFGPLLFGRVWCGYASWTAMILDLLPNKTPQSPCKKIGIILYIVFTIALLFVSALFIFYIPNMERIMFWSFIIGNIIYFSSVKTH